MNIKYITKQLKRVNLNYNIRKSTRILKDLKKIKKIAVKQNDQKMAKELWCFEQILHVQNKYIDAYNLLKTKRYYDAWNSLERFEIGYSSLLKHFSDHDNEYWLEFMNKHVIQYQSIFPYNMFMSPEYLKMEVKCSICNQVINIRNPCGHKKGEIYGGEMCTHLITKGEFIGTSLVFSPGQKYSVVFKNDPKTGQTIDHYNYSSVKFVIDRLQSPFHNWDLQWKKIRQPHSKFAHMKKDEECPCESGKKYKDCCLLESGVLRPHCQIIFSVAPPDNLTMYEYFD